MTSADEFIKKWEKRQGEIRDTRYGTRETEDGKNGEEEGNNPINTNEHQYPINTNEHQYVQMSNQGEILSSLDSTRDSRMTDRQTLGKIQNQEEDEIRAEDIIKEQKRLRTHKRARKVLKHSGTLIFWLSLASTFIILLPFIGIGTKKPKVQSNATPTIKIEHEDVEAKVIKEAEGLGLDARFSLYVPKIDARAKIIENVDMEDSLQYLKALKDGVAHGKGTYFPGQGKNIFLFSHSVSAPEYISTYNAVFYDLKDLGIGDEIIIYFSGVKYVYNVSQISVVAPSNVSFLTEDFGGETLILQTCDPPGTTLRRLLVTAKLSQ